MENTGLKILVHASAFFAPCLVPIILYLVVDDYEIKRLSIQALLFQLMMWIAIFISFILIIVLIGIPLLLVCGLVMLVVPILGIVKALGGETYNYPIVGRFF
ncbi:putative Tic20 family protein [Sporosarcina luteola]|nr:putative Tic20 family protein [Sporosarcina luteola]